VDDTEKAIEIERLLERLSEATTQRSALAAEAQELGARIDDIRAAFGNPYFYSGANYKRPENADESVANYTGFNSHDVVLPTVLDLMRADRKVRRIKTQLRELGAATE
jgi:hypothetical protein